MIFAVGGTGSLGISPEGPARRAARAAAPAGSCDAWRDVGTIDAYWQGHRDLLGPEPTLTLSDPDWPVLGQPVNLPPARFTESAAVWAPS